MPALRPGAHVCPVAPAPPLPRGELDRGGARLRARYRITYHPAITSSHGYLAGDDARRLAELRAALADPDIDAIVAARGGYGTTPLLPHLDP